MLRLTLSILMHRLSLCSLWAVCDHLGCSLSTITPSWIVLPSVDIDASSLVCHWNTPKYSFNNRCEFSAQVMQVLLAWMQQALQQCCWLLMSYISKAQCTMSRIDSAMRK